MIVVLVFAPYSVVRTSAQTSSEMKYPSAAVQLHSDGSFTPDTLSLLNTFGVPEDVLFSESPDYNMELPKHLRDIGFRDVYFDQDLNQWRVSFTSIIDAPLIDIWEDEVQDDGNIKLSADEDDLKSGTTESARSERNMGLSFFYGSESYQLENETDDSGTSWEYGTDFLVDNYNILFLDQIGDYSSSNLTVIVSYVENTSYTNLNATYAYNVTILNEPVDGYDDYWFRLDLENTNSSFDEYVANVEIQNFDVTGGRYILDVDANTTDSRYDTNYIGSLTSSVSVSSQERFKSKISGIDLHTHNVGVKDGLSLNAWYDDTTVSDLLSVPSELTVQASEVVNEARGWASATDLENSIKQSIVDKSDTDNIDDISEVDDLTLTDAIMNWQMPSELTDALSDLVDEAIDRYDTAKDVVTNVADDAVRRVSFATDVTAPDIETEGKQSNEVLDATNGPIASEKDGSNNFGKGIVDWITDTTNSIADGAVSVWSGVKEDVQAGGFMSLLPYLLVGLVVIVAIVIYRRSMM